MVKTYTISDCPLKLSGPYAGEHPLYLAVSSESVELLASVSLPLLLQEMRTKQPLVVSARSVSFFLQSGLVPPPATMFENIYILGIGDSVCITQKNTRLEVEFARTFPFSHQNKSSEHKESYSEVRMLELLARAVETRVQHRKPVFLFHSAGKDSNAIALALSEIGLAAQVTCVTQKSDGSSDESALSASIARNLGFAHRIVGAGGRLTHAQHQFAEEYFENAPLPCSDEVSPAYFFYAQQIPDLKDANIIDGMGNDVYLGHVPTSRELFGQSISCAAPWVRGISDKLCSLNRLQAIGRLRAEWAGLNGLSFSDCRLLFPSATRVAHFWAEADQQLDYLELRAEIRGCMIDHEIFMRKLRNFADATGANAIFPWSNELVAKYCFDLPQAVLFDRESLRNKIFLRDLLKSRIGLDSDSVGKRPFSFDFVGFILSNWRLVLDEVVPCQLWSKSNAETILQRFRMSAEQSGKYQKRAAHLLLRIFLISSWLNHSKYLR
jgi:asparagine synthase (glutamine-hydrolysing)